MTIFKLVRNAFAMGIIASTAIAQTDRNTKTGLPSEMTQQAIKGLQASPMVPLATKDEPKAVDAASQDFRSLSVNREQVDEKERELLEFNADGNADVAFAAPNTVILRFEPDATEEDIKSFLEQHDLKVVRTYPKIGAIQAEGDLSSYFQPQLSDNSANDALMRGLVALIVDFQADDRIRSAAPDLVLRDQSSHTGSELQITNLLTPSDIVSSNLTNAHEVADWGIADIEADQLWQMTGANDGVLFGVMDVGFGRHEDLSFLEFLTGMDVDDHGNHVAAIACGRHGNGVGIKGVLPNCFVRARSGDVFFNSQEGGDVTAFFVLFSQVLATLERFVDTQDDVHTFNVSLGYNWRSNFGINPDLPASSQWRALVEAQGAFLVPLLELANQNERVIFSAAGNDSTGLSTPIGAKYASPFNWAAIIARETGIASNGVIVEAHDPQGNRAPFSNKDGHISCPGVNIFSAVAFDTQGQMSNNTYGKMSGTSMASPYCASGYQLFRLVRRGYGGVEALDCFVQSDATSSSGAPMLRLSQALAACPPKN